MDIIWDRNPSKSEVIHAKAPKLNVNLKKKESCLSIYNEPVLSSEEYACLTLSRFKRHLTKSSTKWSYLKNFKMKPVFLWILCKLKSFRLLKLRNYSVKPVYCRILSSM